MHPHRRREKSLSTCAVVNTSTVGEFDMWPLKFGQQQGYCTLRLEDGTEKSKSRWTSARGGGEMLTVAVSSSMWLEPTGFGSVDAKRW